MLKVLAQDDVLSQEEIVLTLDEIARQGAQRMLAEALEPHCTERFSNINRSIVSG